MQNLYNNKEGNRAYKLEDGELNKDLEAEAHKVYEEGENVASKQEVIDALKKYLSGKKITIKTESGEEEVSVFDRLAFKANDFIYRYTKSNVIDGLDGKDIVQIVVEKIVTLKRKWYKDKVATIGDLIFLCILSEVRNRAKKFNTRKDDPLYKEPEAGVEEKKKRKEKPKIIPLYGTDKDGNRKENCIPDEEKSKRLSKDDFYYEAEKGIEELIEEVEEKLEKKADKDKGLSFYVFQERLEGNHSHIETAKKYGVEVREIANAYKVVKREVINITDNKNKGGHEQKN